MVILGVRGKDKRTETNLKKLHDNINHQILNYKLAFFIIDEQITNYIISSKGIVYNINYENIKIYAFAYRFVWENQCWQVFNIK